MHFTQPVFNQYQLRLLIQYPRKISPQIDSQASPGLRSINIKMGPSRKKPCVIFWLKLNPLKCVKICEKLSKTGPLVTRSSQSFWADAIALLLYYTNVIVIQWLYKVPTSHVPLGHIWLPKASVSAHPSYVSAGSTFSVVQAPETSLP